MKKMTDEDAHPKLLPQRYWGLDPHFRCCMKLFICQVLQASYDSPYKGVFMFKNHPFQKVDVMGVVVGIDQRSKCFVYYIDDGTGVITCTVWNNQLGNHYRLRKLPGLLLRKLDESQEVEEYHLGDLVRVCGKLRIFRNQREIAASFHNKITDPESETNRIKELKYLQQEIYSKPVELPPFVSDWGSLE